MAIPAGIPAGFIDHYNVTTAHTETYDQYNDVATIPESYQSFINPTGVDAVGQGVVVVVGAPNTPRSYFENTINSGVTTKQKLLLT